MDLVLNPNLKKLKRWTQVLCQPLNTSGVDRSPTSPKWPTPSRNVEALSPNRNQNPTILGQHVPSPLADVPSNPAWTPHLFRF